MLRFAGDEFTRELKAYPHNLGRFNGYRVALSATIRPKDTLFDVARRYDLSYYNELEFYIRIWAEWLPPKDKPMVLPTMWVLPSTKHQQLQLIFQNSVFIISTKKDGTVQTYPIGIGDEGWETPVGTFHIYEKRPNPTWYIPASLQEKYGMKSMPPGPDNPMGDFVMKFSAGAYGIHGTNVP